MPGTEAFEKRVGDAAPDEVTIIPETKTETEDLATPQNAAVPKTVVDETADAPGSKTDGFNEDAHKADAAPDFVRKPDGTGEVNTMPASLETKGEATGTAAKSS